MFAVLDLNFFVAVLIMINTVLVNYRAEKLAGPMAQFQIRVSKESKFVLFCSANVGSFTV